MSSHQIAPDFGAFGFTNSLRAGQVGSVATDLTQLNIPNNYTSFAALEAALFAASSTIYSLAELDKMTANDKVFAYRTIADLTTI